MVCELFDPIRQDRHLNVNRPCVTVVLLKVLDNLGLSFLIQNPSWSFSFLLLRHYNTATNTLQRKRKKQLFSLGERCRESFSPDVILQGFLPLVAILRPPPPCCNPAWVPPCCIPAGVPPLVVILGGSSPVVILRGPPYGHSEERTTKNLRCLDTRWVAVEMDQPSEGDRRFLTAFGMTVKGVRTDRLAVRNDRLAVRTDNEGPEWRVGRSD